MKRSLILLKSTLRSQRKGAKGAESQTSALKGRPKNGDKNSRKLRNKHGVAPITTADASAAASLHLIERSQLCSASKDIPQRLSLQQKQLHSQPVSGQLQEQRRPPLLERSLHSVRLRQQQQQQRSDLRLQQDLPRRQLNTAADDSSNRHKSRAGRDTFVGKTADKPKKEEPSSKNDTADNDLIDQKGNKTGENILAAHFYGKAANRGGYTKSKAAAEKRAEAVRKLNTPKRASRYIVFAGGLSLDTTAEQLKDFFKKKLKPYINSVRMLTQRGSNKSRGCAFVEFSNRDALQVALNYHHRELNGRKINIELSAGGGGNSKTRRGRIEEKNKRLKALRRKTYKAKLTLKEKSAAS